MKLTFRLSNFYFLYPFILIILFFALVNSNFSYDLIGIHKKSMHYKLLHGFFMIIPLVLLFNLEYWRNIVLHKKILIASIILFLIGINYRTTNAYQFSVIFAISAIFYFVNEKKIYKPITFSYLLLLYFTVNALSLIWTNNLNYGISMLKLQLPYIYIPILFCFFSLSKKDVDIILLVLIRAIILFIFLSLCSRIIQARFYDIPLFPASLIEKGSTNLMNTFYLVYGWTTANHPTYNAIIQLFALALSWYYIQKRDMEIKLYHSEFVFIIVSTFVMVIFSASRFMLASWVLVNFVGVLYIFRKRKVVFGITIVAILLIAIVFSVKYHHRFTNLYNDPIREIFYKAATESINENTWHGTGLGGMTKYINYKNPIFQQLFTSADFPHNHPHNQLIGDVMQTGVFGFISFVSIFFYLIFIGIKKRDYILLMFTFIFSLLMIIETPLIYQKGIFYFSLISIFLLQKHKNPDALIIFLNNEKKKNIN